MAETAEFSRIEKISDSEARKKRTLAKQAYNDNLKNIVIVAASIIFAMYTLPMFKSADSEKNIDYDELIVNTTQNMSCSWVKDYMNSVPPGLFGVNSIWVSCSIEDFIYCLL